MERVELNSDLVLLLCLVSLVWSLLRRVGWPVCEPQCSTSANFFGAGLYKNTPPCPDFLFFCFCMGSGESNSRPNARLVSTFSSGHLSRCLQSFKWTFFRSPIHFHQLSLLSSVLGRPRSSCVLFPKTHLGFLPDLLGLSSLGHLHSQRT